MASALFLLLANAAPFQATRPERCAPQPGEEIVVCAPRNGPDPYRLPKLPDKYETKPLRAETEIAPGVTAGVNVAGSELPGAEGVGVMVKLKIKF